MHPLQRTILSNRANPGRRFEISAKADQSTAEIFLYDAIVSDELEAEYFGGVAAKPFVQALRELKADTINLRINSPGGSVFAARAIEQALRDHPARVVAHIDGLAASAATFVAMAADEIVMNKGALFMIHKAWSVAFGNANDLMDTAALLEKIDGTLVDTYASRTGQSPQQVAEWMAAETWFTADEAKAAGFVDAIADDKAKALWDLTAMGKQIQPMPEPEPEAPAADLSALLRRLAASTADA